MLQKIWNNIGKSITRTGWVLESPTLMLNTLIRLRLSLEDDIETALDIHDDRTIISLREDKGNIILSAICINKAVSRVVSVPEVLSILVLGEYPKDFWDEYVREYKNQKKGKKKNVEKPDKTTCSDDDIFAPIKPKKPSKKASKK